MIKTMIIFTALFFAAGAIIALRCREAVRRAQRNKRFSHANPSRTFFRHDDNISKFNDFGYADKGLPSYTGGISIGIKERAEYAMRRYNHNKTKKRRR